MKLYCIRKKNLEEYLVGAFYNHSACKFYVNFLNTPVYFGLPRIKEEIDFIYHCMKDVDLSELEIIACDCKETKTKVSINSITKSIEAKLIIQRLKS